MAEDLTAEFDEFWYLRTYPDVARAIRAGECPSAAEHFIKHGRFEGRVPSPQSEPSPKSEGGPAIAYKHFVSLCAIVRNEGKYLREWVAFHQAVGIDHFYIYDNESTDETSEVLDQLQDLGVVTKTDWPSSHPDVVRSGVGPQVPAYIDFLRYRDETRWVGFLDLDEFVVPHSCADFRQWLIACEPFSAVGLNWRMFGSSGHTDYSNGLVIERFTRCAPKDFDPNRHVKTFAQTRQIERPGIHLCHVKSGALVDAEGAPIDPARDGIHSRVATSQVQINHYFTKSKAEWTAKRNRGRATRPEGDPEKFRRVVDFDFYDRNEEKDLSALRFREATLLNLQGLV